MSIAHLTKKEVLDLAKACGVGDEDISEEDTVVTDYGDVTEDVLRFAEKLTAGAHAEICRLRAEVERLRLTRSMCWTATRPKRLPPTGYALQQRLHDELAEAQAAELSLLRKDAERYRFIRAATEEGDTVLTQGPAPELDATVDSWVQRVNHEQN
jgi:hypothetical protein